MTAHKPLLIQKDRRGIERIPARDFITPVFQWSDAPSQVEVIDISICGAALEYTHDAMAIHDVFEIDLKIPDGFTVKDLRFAKITDETKETKAGAFETTLRGRFLDLTDIKHNQLKRIGMSHLKVEKRP